MTAPAEPFVPIRVGELVELLAGHVPDPATFRRVARALSVRLHADRHTDLQSLKATYGPFDPDADTVSVVPGVPANLSALFEGFSAVLARANYHRMTRVELETVMKGASAWGVDMNVPWDAYERVDVFVRGRGLGTRPKRRWWWPFRKDLISVPTYNRVAIALKQKPHPRLGPDADTTHVSLKLFKDIPQMDVEMLLPGTRIRMALFDRLKLGGSGLGSLGYVLYRLATTVSFAALTVAFSGSFWKLLILYSPLALIIGYGYRTYASFQSVRKTYMLQLTQSLYFQNLDTNAGCLHRLCDEAEDQDLRELLLAYAMLLGEGHANAAALDGAVEAFLHAKAGLRVDFEVDDALGKLDRYNLLSRADGRLGVVPPDRAVDLLSRGSPP
jgi:hypothetical protein